MKKLLMLLLSLSLLLMVHVCYAEASLTEAPYVLYAVTAGKADALLLKAEDHAYLIDTGYARSRGQILYGMKMLGIDRLDAVFITHTDKDHTDGLEWLAASDLEIGAWYAPAYYTGVKASKHPMAKATNIRGEHVQWLQAGDSFQLGEATLEVLAPGTLFEDKDDNNSLVLMLRTPYGNMLLCGDMEYPQEAWLLQSGADLNCDVLKVPNHADDDVCSETFLKAASPQIAVISTDTSEKTSTPDPQLMKLLKRYCSLIAQTQDTDGGIAVTLTADGAKGYAVSLPEAAEGMRITSVDADEIVLKNTGSAAQDLSGWYMITDRKDTCYVFPAGTIVQPGETFIVGSRAATGDVDSRWDEKKLINEKKTDGVTLYDAYGHIIAYENNGL